MRYLIIHVSKVQSRQSKKVRGLQVDVVSLEPFETVLESSFNILNALGFGAQEEA